MNESRFNRNMHLRESIEIIVMVGVAAAILYLADKVGDSTRPWLVWLVVIVAFSKTIYYFAESLWHLLQAAACDLRYHVFLTVMGYNMAEVTISFAIDFYCLYRLDPQSITGILPNLGAPELFFQCFYFSVLNFSFFGYGDILPAQVPSKIVMLLEVITAFTTVIFLISDFVSMKDSMRKDRSIN